MSLNRRELLQAAASAGTAGLIAGTAALLGPGAAARPAQALRPPGALAEPQFLGACLRCGLCVRACPPQNLHLSDAAGAARAVPVGTPYFVAREIPCEMCEELPCVRACPSGALDPHLHDISQARMGLAVLIDHENCLNFLGLRCDVCYRVCPLIDQAITLEKISNPRSDRHAMFLPTVHAEACTGCGKCEKACVLEQPAIKVLPRELACGELGHHYRKGWAAENQPGRPQFEQPTQNLPAQPVPGDLVPLRSGNAPYAPAGPGAAR
ncbi:MAG: hypothetical protein RJA44_403 [Pseudomonadota bacterium]